MDVKINEVFKITKKEIENLPQVGVKFSPLAYVPYFEKIE
jgi:hypothetical protein